MIKKGPIIVILTLLFTGVSAQQISHQVLVPFASITSDGGICISQTVGEAVVDYLGATDYFLTQGFQQPSFVLDQPVIPNGRGVKVYPNPVINNDLIIELFGEESTIYHVSIISMAGALYFRKDYPVTGKFWHRIPIDISTFSRGTFFVRVYCEDGSISRLFKIEKL